LVDCLNSDAIAELDEHVTTYLRTSSARATEEDSEAFDQIVDKLREHGRQLRAQHNTRLSVSRLPAEMLTAVFGYLIPAARLDYEDNPVNPNALAFSQVCQTWHAVALASPGLWAQPLFCWPRLASTMISRTANLPLTLICKLNGRTLGLIHQSTLRSNPIHTLRLHVNDLDFERLSHNRLHDVLIAALPRVQRLDIRQRPTWPQTYHPVFLTYHEESLDRLAGQLTSLSLQNCTLGRSSYLGSHLTFLAVEYDRPAESVVFSIARTTEGLNMLRAAPRLVELRIKHWLGDRPTLREANDLSIPLRDLERVVIVDHSRMLALFLVFCLAPVCTSIKLNYMPFGITSPHDHLCILMKEYYAHYAAVPHPRSLAFLATVVELDKRDEATPTIELDVGLARQLVNPLIINSLHTRSIVDLDIDCMYGIFMPDSDWGAILDAMPSLRILRLGTYEWWTVGPVLCTRAGEGNVPELEAMHLRRVDFAHMLKGDVVGPYEQLGRFLDTYDVLFRLPLLVFSGCLFPQCGVLPLPDDKEIGEMWDHTFQPRFMEVADQAEMTFTLEDRAHWNQALEKIRQIQQDVAAREAEDGVVDVAE
jgi:hypothetical protein